MTSASLFTGFGIADVGMMQAGFTPDWGLELDPRKADVAEANLPIRVHRGNIMDFDPQDFGRVDALHASPPCPNFSAAKSGAEETAFDIALAEKTSEFVRVLRPDWFTLENVCGYRKSTSFAVITNALTRMGYRFQVKKLNAANYGVPQTRERLILWASLNGTVPSSIKPTHAKNPRKDGLFGGCGKLPWVGWYQAVEDLLPTLKETRLAPWQLERLPELNGSLLVSGVPRLNNTKITAIDKRMPSFTVTAETGKRQPARAVLIGSQNTRQEGSGIRAGTDPAMTMNKGQKPRAVLIGNGERSVPRDGETPSPTVTANHNQATIRAVLIDPNNATRNLSTRLPGEPAVTITASHMRRPSTQIKALTGNRVVQLSVRCLARFQSIPGWYKLPTDGLPGSKTLACSGIGNAVPALLMQRVYEALLR